MASSQPIPQSPSRHDPGFSPAPSPSPSPSRSNFYHPRVRKDSEANAHPYAIKTTSTALLSRANSNSGGHKVNDYARHHHYVPPSPTSSSNDEAGPPQSPRHNRVSKHRYSRSLTDDGPPPLPAPPQASSSEEDAPLKEADDTPTRRRKAKLRPKRPSGIQTSRSNLPEDPATWTPSELSTYIVSALKLSAAGTNGATAPTEGPALPERVALDIASFVRRKGMTGQFFLNLTESDLNAYSLNQLWRTSLLKISNSLREGNVVLRGLRCESPVQGDDEATSDLSSSSSTGPSPRNSMDTFAFPGHQGTSRHRHSSSAGRVRDLVENLERSTSLENDENGRRSASPTKRALPQRGRVESLFYAPPLPPSTTSPTNQRHSGSYQSRPLPFPPMIAQHQTGPPSQPPYPQPPTSYPIIPSHTGPAFLPRPPPPPGSEYEMGFRSGTAPLPTQSFPPPTLPHDPTRQIFVVQHRPASTLLSSSDDGEGDDPTITDAKHKTKRRLLPYPPVMGEAQLHHPRPRRGNAEGISEQLDRQLADDVEEPTMEELLRNEDPSLPQVPISGADAWELMESGDTVKRVPSDGSTGSASASSSSSSLPPPTPTELGPEISVEVASADLPDDASMSMTSAPPMVAPPSPSSSTTSGLAPKPITPGSKAKSLRVKSNKRPLQPDVGHHDPSASELGRKAGYKTMASLNEEGAADFTSNAARSMAFRTAPRKSAEREAGMPQGLASLFTVTQPSADVPVETVVQNEEGGREEKEQELKAREISVDAREKDVGRREEELTQRSRELDDRTSSLDVLREILVKGRQEVEERENEVVDREASLKSRQSALDHREWALDARERVLSEHEESMAERERKLKEDRGRVEDVEAVLAKRIAELDAEKREIDERKADLDQERQSLEDAKAKISTGNTRMTNVPEASSTDDSPADSSSTSTSSIPPASSQDHASTALWPIPSSFVRTCFNALLLPILGEERTETILQNLDPNLAGTVTGSLTAASSSGMGVRRRTTMTSRATDEEAQPLLPPPDSSSSTAQTQTQTGTNNVFIPRGGKGSYIILMSIGVCAIALKVLSRRMGAVAVSRR